MIASLPGSAAAVDLGDLGDLGHRDGQRGPQRGGGQVRQPDRDVLDVQHGQLGLGDGGEVGTRQHNQLVAVGGTQRLDGGGPGQARGSPAGRACGRRVRIGADGREQDGRGIASGPPRLVAQPVPEPRVDREVVGERRGAAQQGQQPPAQPHLGAERGVEHAAVGQSRGEPLCRPQREVRIRAARQSPHQLSAPAAGRSSAHHPSWVSVASAHGPVSPRRAREAPARVTRTDPAPFPSRI